MYIFMEPILFGIKKNCLKNFFGSLLFKFPNFQLGISFFVEVERSKKNVGIAEIGYELHDLKKKII